jgi:hypothetical protein
VKGILIVIVAVLKKMQVIKSSSMSMLMSHVTSVIQGIKLKVRLEEIYPTLMMVLKFFQVK